MLNLRKPSAAAAIAVVAAVVFGGLLWAPLSFSPRPQAQSVQEPTGSVPRPDAALAAVLGAVVADAAAVACHWEYSPAKIAAAVGSGDPAFHSPSISPFYTVDAGLNSGYGDLILAGLHAVVPDGSFSVSDYANQLQATFGAGSPYATALAARPSGAMTGPVPGPWLFSSIKGSLANVEARAAAGDVARGAFGDTKTDDTDGLEVALAVVAVQATKGLTNPAAVDAAIQVAVTKPSTVAFAKASASILRAVIGGYSIRAAVEGELALHPESADGVHTAIATVLAEVDAGTPYSQASSKYGIGCPNPASFKCALHAALTASSYADAVRQIILGGGDSCSRAVFAGALLAASEGAQSIPQAWISKAKNADAAGADLAALLQ